MLLRILFLIVLALPHSFALSQIRPIPQFDLRPDGADHLDVLLSEYSTASTPGFSLLVGTRESILYTYQTGLANLASEAPIERDTPFYIASVGKTVTAFAILKLKEQDKLALEDPITTYLPQLPSLYRQVTVMHQLTHQSGIPDYYDVLGDVAGLTNEDILGFAAGLDSLRFSPGYSYAYSNTAYVLLSEIIQQVSGMSYAAYVSQTFFQALGMRNTIVVDSPEARLLTAATGYSKTDSGSWEVNDRESYVTGPGGIYSTLDDLYLW